ncbi:hypothetical protein CYMTET_37450 [Cymbomonas tetramitiformis]|uniref:Protein kinase domain-containing protein n=1 Tax=Cymbomonas tetramitiformis TaxID=36881 RepID=A0AAE0F5Z3_9CHLO|nr:hypothetical protein CYMTET_37450 [Cymbomonas tetramitiformis]|eukprot:gene9798-11606_t
MDDDDVPGVNFVLDFLRAHNFPKAEKSLLEELRLIELSKKVVEEEEEDEHPPLQRSNSDPSRMCADALEADTPTNTLQDGLGRTGGLDNLLGSFDNSVKSEKTAGASPQSVEGTQIKLEVEESIARGVPLEAWGDIRSKAERFDVDDIFSGGDSEAVELSPLKSRDGYGSDEYDDEEDVGYVREDVIDTVAFLATEVDFDSDEEECYGDDAPPSGEGSEADEEEEEAVLVQQYFKQRREQQEQKDTEKEAESPSQPVTSPPAEDKEDGFSFPSVANAGSEDVTLSASAFGWEGETPRSKASEKEELISPDGGQNASEPEPEAETDPELEQPDMDDADPDPLPEDDEQYETFDLKVIHRRGHTGFEESKDFPIRMNSIIAGRYQVMEFLGSAAFSKAIQALDLQTGMLVCIKIIKNNKDFFDQSLDEIKLLKYINRHDPTDERGVLRLYDFFYCKEHLFIVCELLRANLYEFQKYNRESGDEPYFTMHRLQMVARQCLSSLEFLHSLGLMHCDLKPENILIKSYSRCEVKIIDMGSSCFTTDHLSSYVQSRSYRAPEVILGASYGQKIDIWSVGCILAELFTGLVLFQNDSLATLLARVIGILGGFESSFLTRCRLGYKYISRSGQLYERDPNTGAINILHPKHTHLKYRLPGADPLFVDFVSYLLTVDPDKRPTAAEALQHKWLTTPISA